MAPPPPRRLPTARSGRVRPGLPRPAAMASGPVPAPVVFRAVCPTLGAVTPLVMTGLGGLASVGTHLLLGGVLGPGASLVTVLFVGLLITGLALRHGLSDRWVADPQTRFVLREHTVLGRLTHLERLAFNEVRAVVVERQGDEEGSWVLLIRCDGGRDHVVTRRVDDPDALRERAGRLARLLRVPVMRHTRATGRSTLGLMAC